MKNYNASDRNEAQSSRHTKDYWKNRKAELRKTSAASKGNPSKENNRSR